MKKYYTRILFIMLITLCCNFFYLYYPVSASQLDTSSITKAVSGGITLEGENINISENSKTIYITVDSTGMENGLAGYSARLQMTPCGSVKHGWIYGTANPKIEVLTSNWEVGLSNFSGWNEKSYLDFTIEASDEILNTIPKSSAVKIAITFPITSPTSNWKEVEPYTDLSIMNTLKRTDCKNNVDMPLSDLLNIRLTENKQSPTEKANITINLSKYSLQKGDTFVATIGIIGTSQGVSGLQGTWNYNRDIFECIERNVLFEKWRLTGWNKDSGVFLMEIIDFQDSNSYVKDEKSIISFTFKVKEDANISDEEIEETLTISNLVVAGGVELEENTISKNVKITLDSNVQPDPDDPSNEDEPNTPPNNEDKPNNSTGSNTSTNTLDEDSNNNSPNGNNLTNSNDSTIANSSLPKAGKGFMAILIILLGGVFVCYSYIRYTRY